MRTSVTALLFVGLLLSSHAGFAAEVDGTKLLDAAQSSNTKAVRSLLAEGFDPNVQTADGTTPLLFAAHFGDIASARALLAAGGDPNLTNRYNVAPMHEASLRADAELLRALIDAGAKVDAALPAGETPLMLLSRTDSPDAVKLLIARGANPNVVESWQGQTPLMYAAANDRGSVAAALIAAGADVNAKTPVNDLPERIHAVRYFVEIPSAGLTPVLFAARHGAVSALRVLIDAGADVNAKTPEGFSPLIVSLDNLHYDAAKVLLDAGASPAGGALFAVVEARNRINYVGGVQIPTGTTTPLELLAQMLSRGADVTDRLPEPLLDREPRFLPPPPKTVDWALIRAARSADIESMRLLVDAGADPSRRDDKRGGINALVAVTTGPEVPPLVETERRPTEEDAIAAIDFLLDHGVDPNMANDAGATAVHMAALRNYDGLLKHMATRGANLDVADRKGFTPLDYALGNSSPALRDRAAGVANQTTAAVLRGLGAHGRDELGKQQRTAAR